MSRSVVVSGLVIPYSPSLSHLASVRVAMAFFRYFHNKMLNKIFELIQNGHSVEFIANSYDCDETEWERAKAIILFIPVHLRSIVLKSVNGMRHSYVSCFWQTSRNMNTQFTNDTVIYWRSDGTIDKVKTAQRMVLDENINIRKRFDIARVFCFEESMQTLWLEMSASDKSECLMAVESMSHFWVSWLSNGRQVPFSQAALEYLKPRPYFLCPFPRFSSFFPSLKPKDRRAFLYYLMASTLDDMRFCLRAVTKEEEEQFLKWHGRVYLLLHLQWPFQGLFLETAEKMWEFLNDRDFLFLLRAILKFKSARKDFDYGELFESFWNRGPHHLRGSIERRHFLEKEKTR